MDFNKLRTFCTVAEEGSVTKAAWQLSRTQSAITQQIQLLEEELGLVLLERRSARVFLTREGERLYGFARNRLQDIEDEALRMKKDSTELGGTIRICAVDEFFSFVMPDLIDGFIKQYPNILIEVDSGPHKVVEQALIENRADFGLMVLYENRNMFKITPYFSFEVTCVATPAYLKKCGGVENFGDLLERDIIDAQQRVPSFRFWIKKNAPELVPKFANKQAYITIRGPQVQKELVMRGQGIGLLARPPIEQELKSGKLVEILPGKAEPIYVVADISRRKTHTSHLIHEKFLDYVKEKSKETLNWQPD